MASQKYTALVKEPKGPAPIIYALHGTGGDEHQFFGLAQELLPDAGVISPRGDVSEMGASRFFRRNGEGIYDMQDLARATAKMAKFVAAQKAENPNSPIYGFGYSNGANILATVMIEHPGLFDRVGLLHPLIPWAQEPVSGLSKTKVLLTAGQRDPICPWPQTEALTAWLQDQGAELTTYYHGGGHELRREELSALATFLQNNEVYRYQPDHDLRGS